MQDHNRYYTIANQRVKHNVALSSRTWIHRGGIVENYFQPLSVEELRSIALYLYFQNENFDVIGHTSNMYFLNTYNVKNLIDTRKVLAPYHIEKNILRVAAGEPTAKIAKYLTNKGISGYEGLIDIPGTIAGAVVNNSGSYGCGIESILREVELLTSTGEVKIIKNADLLYSKRSSALKRGEIKGVILWVYLDISRYEPIEILRNKVYLYHADRELTQEGRTHNLGSTYCVLQYKHNLRNYTVKGIIKMLQIIGTNSTKQKRIQKYLYLLLYRQTKLSHYISDKNLGCFIWADMGADIAFPHYMEFMEKVFYRPTMEIEIKK